MLDVVLCGYLEVYVVIVVEWGDVVEMVDELMEVLKYC